MTKQKYYADTLSKAREEGQVTSEEKAMAQYMFYKGIQAEVNRTKTNNLTPAQAYSLSLLIADYLTEFHEDLVTLKSYSRHCWKLADPNSTDGEQYFKELNKVRTAIKKVKSKIRQIESGQKVLKSISKS